jgi:hypothetical protein
MNHRKGGTCYGNIWHGITACRARDASVSVKCTKHETASQNFDTSDNARTAGPGSINTNLLGDAHNDHVLALKFDLSVCEVVCLKRACM